MPHTTRSRLLAAGALGIALLLLIRVLRQPSRRPVSPVVAVPTPVVPAGVPAEPERPMRWRRLVLAGAGFALVALSLPSVIQLVTTGAASATTALTVVETDSPIVTAPPARSSGTAPVSPPSRVTIAAIGVSAPVNQLRLDADGRLLPPKDFTSVGWYAGGPVPGAPGAALLTGHVDSYEGPAVFHRMERLGTGDVITVQRQDRSTARFSVTRLESYSKDRFPTARVFDGVASAELRLITCGGDFDPVTKSYTRNTVVFARLLPPPSPPMRTHARVVT